MPLIVTVLCLYLVKHRDNGRHLFKFSFAERSSTRHTARPALFAETSGDDMQVDSEYEQYLAESESSSRGNLKKRKSHENKVNPQAKKFRGIRGLLKQLVEMPLDVLFEVCAALHFLME